MASEDSSHPESSVHHLRIPPDTKQATGHRRRWWRALLAVLVILFAGASAWVYRATLGQPPLVQVAFAQFVGAGEKMGGPVLSGAGYVVTGDRYISLGVRVPGRIDEYTVEEGDFVRKGDVLVRLDSRDYQAVLRKNEANLELKKASHVLKHKKFERISELHASGIVSDESLDVAEHELAAAQAEIHQAEADIDLAKVNLNHTTLTAPASGVVLAKLKEVGEIAVPGGFFGSGDLIRLANMNDLRCEVDINEVDFRQVRLNQQADVVPDAYTDRKYPAQVVKIYPQVNRQKGTIKVELKLNKIDEDLRPDMSVRINFLPEASTAQTGTPRVIVPVASLHGEGYDTFVWTVHNGQVQRTPVEVGKDLGENREISSGLEGGEILVLFSPTDIKEGMAVGVSRESPLH